MNQQLFVRTSGKGLYEFTPEVEQVVSAARIDNGLCVVFLQHTSAGLIIQENADPSAKRDLEVWLEKHVPEGANYYTHTAEGPDDMPSHIRSVLTGISLSIPIVNGRLALGTWQGIYLWEHRSSAHRRSVIVHIAADMY